jgi:hypothetical protein
MGTDFPAWMAEFNQQTSKLCQQLSRDNSRMHFRQHSSMDCNQAINERGGWTYWSVNSHVAPL